ncbi:acyl-CoA dehydratase activase [Thermosulfuriphilus sp.]
MGNLHIGLDVGSGGAKIIVLDDQAQILFEDYRRTHGQPIQTAYAMLKEMEETLGEQTYTLTCTGTAGKFLARLLGVNFINEVICHTKGVEFFHPEARTIVDIGGEDSKLIFVGHGPDGRFYIEDFALNTMCAAGTGAFLDQQAARLGYSIEEFSRLALKAKTIPRIAGRCTVFAKSDMIHLQQAAVPDYEIIAGLCFAIVRNLKSNIAKGRRIRPPLVFQGGVAANHGVRRAFVEIFGLKDGELIIPEHFATMGAMGAALHALEEANWATAYPGPQTLKDYLSGLKEKTKRFPALRPPKSGRLSYSPPSAGVSNSKRIEAYLGIDVGSVSTKLVVIDKNMRLLAKKYLYSSGRPLEAIKEGLAAISEDLPPGVEICGVGTTGSGRYLTGDFVGADVIRNEITAQATAAAAIDPQVDTIIEIGGQDSKFIRLERGTIVDFTMNKACAAGTGSFLEEQAVRLGISIEDFGRLALKSEAPVKMGERCTVFMQSDLVHYQQRGIPKEDLCAGLCYAIVYNYLTKVVEKRPIGKKVFYQGATALNPGVVAAFEAVLGQEVVVPPHNEVTGAIGAAILAMRERTWEKSRFRGFDLSQVSYQISSFECQGCPNCCEIRKVSIEGRPPLFYGGRCEKYEVKRHREGQELPDLVSEREALLLSYLKEDISGEIVGIPRTLFFLEWLPFFATLFQELGYRVVVSGPTTKRLVSRGIEAMVNETCFPIKVAHGHVLELLEQGVKNIFLPQIADLPSGHPRLPSGHVCPYCQSLAWTIHAAIDFAAYGARAIQPVFHFGDEKTLAGDFKQFAKMLKVRPARMEKVVRKAWEAQRDFWRRLKERGQEILAGLKPSEKAVVIVGRPYNALDPGSNLYVHKKLRDLGIKAIPMDFLPLDEIDQDLEEIAEVYWRYGQKILSAAVFCRQHPALFPVFITNFACGPDSFILHFFKDHLGDKPFLELEIDEHSADAGALTRIEAFLDSIGQTRFGRRQEKRPRPQPRPSDGRILYIPYMCDHSHSLAAAFRACGLEAQVLPISDEEAVQLGRQYTSGKECYPAVLTTGDMIKMTRQRDFDPNRAAFFMPSGTGPCRFGQYNRLHRAVLDELGFSSVPIYSPNQSYTLYEEMGMVGKDFTRLAWQGVVAVDVLDKMRREIRPYETVPGMTDQCYQHYLERICQALERREDLVTVLMEAREAFEHIPVKDRGKRPVVGIVGEIYTRANDFANENIIRTLEALGAEVWTPTISEWILYVNFTAKRRARRHNQWRHYAKLLIEHKVQISDEKRFERVVEGLVRSVPEPDASELVEWASPYVSPEFEGEAILSVGKSLDYILRGVHGIVNVIPFTCMPGAIAAALLKRLKEDHQNIPCLTLAYDGQRETTTITRLEAFIYQVNQFRERRLRAAA